jgi:hypothetical protein
MKRDRDTLIFFCAGLGLLMSGAMFGTLVGMLVWGGR